MPTSPFQDKSTPPTPGELARALGRSAAVWDRLREHLADEYGPLTETWKFYKHWTLQLRSKQRTILWLTPHTKYFLASTAFGERATKAALASDLPREAKALIEAAPKYAEGRAVRIEVRLQRDLETLRKVAAIKMAN